MIKSYKKIRNYTKSIIPGPGPFQKVQHLKTTFKLLIHKAKEMSKLLKEEESLSEYKFSEVRQAFKDQIEQELENAKKQMDGFMAHNPEKVLKSIESHLIMP